MEVTHPRVAIKDIDVVASVEIVNGTFSVDLERVYEIRVRL